MSSELYFPAPLCLCVVPLPSSLRSSVSQLNSSYLHLVNLAYVYIGAPAPQRLPARLLI